MQIGYQFVPHDPNYYLEYLPRSVDLDTVWLSVQFEQEPTGTVKWYFELLYDGDKVVVLGSEHIAAADEQNYLDFIQSVQPNMLEVLGTQWRGPRAS